MTFSSLLPPPPHPSSTSSPSLRQDRSISNSTVATRRSHKNNNNHTNAVSLSGTTSSWEDFLRIGPGTAATSSPPSPTKEDSSDPGPSIQDFFPSDFTISSSTTITSPPFQSQALPRSSPPLNSQEMLQSKTKKSKSSGRLPPPLATAAAKASSLPSLDGALPVSDLFFLPPTVQPQTKSGPNGNTIPEASSSLPPPPSSSSINEVLQVSDLFFRPSNAGNQGGRSSRSNNAVKGVTNSKTPTSPSSSPQPKQGHPVDRSEGSNHPTAAVSSSSSKEDSTATVATGDNNTQNNGLHNDSKKKRRGSNRKMVRRGMEMLVGGVPINADPPVRAIELHYQQPIYDLSAAKDAESVFNTLQDYDWAAAISLSTRDFGPFWYDGFIHKMEKRISKSDGTQSPQPSPCFTPSELGLYCEHFCHAAMKWDVCPKDLRDIVKSYQKEQLERSPPSIMTLTNNIKSSLRDVVWLEKDLAAEGKSVNRTEVSGISPLVGDDDDDEERMLPATHADEDDEDDTVESLRVVFDETSNPTELTAEDPKTPSKSLAQKARTVKSTGTKVTSGKMQISTDQSHLRVNRSRPTSELIHFEDDYPGDPDSSSASQAVAARGFGKQASVRAKPRDRDKKPLDLIVNFTFPLDASRAQLAQATGGGTAEDFFRDILALAIAYDLYDSKFGDHLRTIVLQVMVLDFTVVDVGPECVDVNVKCLLTSSTSFKEVERQRFKRMIKACLTEDIDAKALPLAVLVTAKEKPYFSRDIIQDLLGKTFFQTPLVTPEEMTFHLAFVTDIPKAVLLSGDCERPGDIFKIVLLRVFMIILSEETEGLHPSIVGLDLTDDTADNGSSTIVKVTCRLASGRLTSIDILNKKSKHISSVINQAIDDGVFLLAMAEVAKREMRWSKEVRDLVVDVWQLEDSDDDDDDEEEEEEEETENEVDSSLSDEPVHDDKHSFFDSDSVDDPNVHSETLSDGTALPSPSRNGLYRDALFDPSNSPFHGEIGVRLVDAVTQRAKERHPRVIAIGDVHGCLDELQDLLRQCDYRPGDLVVFLGDLVCKGPDSLSVVQMAREIGAIGVRGNHDFEVVRWHHAIQSGVDPPVVGSEHFHIASCLSQADIEWMYKLPWYISSKELGALFVHAGFVSGIRLAKQNPRLMMNMRSILPDGTVTSKFFNNWPWARLWDGPQTVLFGHDADRGLQQYEHAIGLDTGCVYGGRLTACILPEKRLVSVSARREYFKYRRKHYD